MTTRRQLSTPIAITVTLGMILGLLLTGVIAAFAAYGEQNFRNIYEEQLNGEIAITGNMLLTCDRTNSQCADALSNKTSTSNNDMLMTYLDVDKDPNTYASSRVDVEIPTGAEVEKAFLLWGATTKEGIGGQPAATKVKDIKFKVPGAADYTVIAPDKEYNFTNIKQDYSAYADVTAQVKSAGSGGYWAADAPMSTGKDCYAGWSLVVVLKGPQYPMRDLRIFSGYKQIHSKNTQAVTIDGFITPPHDKVNAKVGMVVFEGDKKYRNDQLLLYPQGATKGTPLSDALSPVDNFFVSRVSKDGVNIENRYPNNVSNLGIDAKTVDVSGLIKNSDSSVKLEFTSRGDWYYPTLLTTQIDVYVPEFSGAGIKQVTNLSGHSPAKVGDILQYNIRVHNTGKDAADHFVLTDDFPEGTEYVPGSLKVGKRAGSVNVEDQSPQTDTVGDDLAEVTASGIVARVGKGATPTLGGTIEPNEQYGVSFRVKVLPEAAGQTITNGADFSYIQHTLNKPGSNTTNETKTPVDFIADVGIEKTGPTTAKAGETVKWTLTAKNHGPNGARNVVLNDTVPEGISNISVADDGCSVEDRHVKCDLGFLKKNDTKTVTVLGTIDADMETGHIVNIAKIKTNTSEGENAHPNTATQVTQVTRYADLELVSKTVEPQSGAPGTEQIWTLTVKNKGPSSAKAVSVTDTLPDGFIVKTATASPTGATCGNDAQDVTCQLGDMQAGDTATVTITTKLEPEWEGTQPMSNTASVSSVTPDANRDNNSNQATFTPTASKSAVTIDKFSTDKEVYAGTIAHYSLLIGNTGPSTARNVSITDTFPTDMVPTKASLPAGKCTIDGQKVTCTVPQLSVGSAIIARIEAKVDPAAEGALTNTARIVADNDSVGASDTETVNVISEADLVMKKIDPQEEVSAGTDTHFYLEVSNKGPAVAKNVIISDNISSDFTPGTPSFEQGNGTCDWNGATRLYTCSISGISPGDTVRVKLPISIAAGTNVMMATNTAKAVSDNDPNETNNTSSTQFQVKTSADLSLDKSTTTTKAIAGESITWKIVGTNHGPSNASDIVIVDTLPDEVLPGDKHIQVKSPDSDLKCTITERTVKCEKSQVLAKDAPNNTTKVYITAKVDPATQKKKMTNTAKITSATEDRSPGNNADSVTTPLARHADIETEKTGPDTLIAGKNGTWTIKATNTGPSAATKIVVADRLPSGFSFVKAEGPLTCTEEGTLVVCGRDDDVSLAPQESLEMKITAKLAPSAKSGQTVTNTATAFSTDVPDDNPDNDVAESKSQVHSEEKLSIKKSLTSASLVAGTQSMYHVTVTNEGPSWARNITVSDTLPQGLTPGEVQSSGKCTVNGRKITCSFESLAVGEANGLNIVIPVTVGEKVTLDSQGNVVNTAQVTSEQTTTPVKATTKTRLVRAADLALTKETEVDSVHAGSGLTWTLGVLNKGPSLAQGVVLTDRLPAGVEFVSASHDDCTYAEEQQRLVICKVGNLANGQEKYRDIVVKIHPGVSKILSNTAKVSQSQEVTDPNMDNNTAISNVEVTRYSELEIDKKADSPRIEAGGQSKWTITLSNNGPSVATNAVVTDTFAEGLIPQEVTTEGGTCTIEGQKLTCNYEKLPIGSSIIHVTAEVAHNIKGNTITNTAKVTTASPSNAEVEDTAQVDIKREADMSIAKTLAPYNPVPGQEVTYTLSASNAGPATTPKATIEDRLPEGLSDIVVIPPTGVTCTVSEPIEADENIVASSGHLECSIDQPMAPGAKKDITVTAKMRSDLQGTIENSATVAPSVHDPDGNNNVSQVSATLAPVADVALEKTLKGEAVAGKFVEWNIVVTNNAGPSHAHDLTIVDDLPAGISNVTASRSDKGEACTIQAQTLTCQRKTLAPEASFTITVKGQLSQDFSGDLNNRATVTTTGSKDSDLTNNTSVITTPTQQSADLSIVKTLRGTALSGSDVVWDIQVANAGPSSSTDVEVRDVIPDGITNAKVSGTHSDKCTIAKQNLTCRFDSLDSGASVSLSMSGKLDAAYSGELSNTATVQSGSDTGGTPDPQTGNNSSTATHTTVQSADVWVTKQLVTKEAVAGSTVQWTIGVGNRGPSVARGVTLTDSLPEGITNVKVKRADGKQCLVEGHAITCEFDELMPEQTHDIEVTATLDEDFRGEVDNHVSITSTTPDPDTSNNSDRVASPSEKKAQLSIHKTIDGQAISGRDVVWTIVASNAGPSAAHNVVVSDPLPQGLSNVKAQRDDAGLCDVVGGMVRCEVEKLASGKNVRVTVTGTLAPEFIGELTNTATVTSDLGDDGTGPQKSEVSLATQQQADLMIQRELTGELVAGKKAIWNLVGTNDGPSVAHDVIIRYTVPRGVTDVNVNGADGVTCSVKDGTVECAIPQLAPGQKVELTVVGKVPAGAVDPASDEATIESSTDDPDLSNNKVSETIPLQQVSAITVEKKADRQKIVSGQLLTWKVRVTNSGPSDMRQVQVIDTLPGNAQLKGKIIAPQGVECGAVKDVVTCTIDKLEKEATVKIQIPTILTSDTTIMVTNAVTVVPPVGVAQDSTLSSDATVEVLKKPEPTEPVEPMEPGEPTVPSTTSPAGKAPEGEGSSKTPHPKPVRLSQTGASGAVGAAALMLCVIGLLTIQVNRRYQRDRLL
ncbi:MAG: hypothetical protein Q4P66_09085 [Actinomycetaceae bacterium]|nr:hypothetical protein [Actinomycetaceae bacterium]